MPENNSLAKVTLSVQISKKETYDQIKAMMKDAQAECDDNALTIKTKADKATLKKLIEDIQKIDVNKDVKFIARAKELREIIDKAIAGIDATVPITADTSELDKKLELEKQKLNDMQVTSKQLSAAAKKLGNSKNYYKDAAKLVQMYEQFTKLGGKLSASDTIIDPGDNKSISLEKYINGLKMMAEVKAEIASHPLQIFSKGDVAKQEKVIADLVAEIEKARQAAREGIGGTAEGVGIGSAKVGTEPEVNAEEFAKKVSEQLTVPAQIGLVGAISDPVSFAEDVSKQLTSPATIEVKGNVSDPQGFANSVSEQIRSASIQSAEQTQLATDEIDDEGKAAKEASKWKQEFAEANEKVAKASKHTAKNTKEATKEIENEGNAARKSFKENADLLRFLTEIRQGTNTVQFGISIDKEMAEAELKRIAPEIAASFNKQYGTNLTGAQVVKAYKASLKEQRAAEEKALQDHLDELEKRAQADEEVFQKQIQNWKDYIQQTEEARKENEEYRQLKTFDDAMAYANQQAADELEYQQKLAMYKAQGAAQIKDIIAEEKEHAAWVEEVCKKQEESNALMQKQLDDAEQLAVYDMAMEYKNQQDAEEAEYLKKRNEYLEYGRQQEEEYLRQAKDIARTFEEADKAQESSSTQHNKEAAKAYDKLFSSAKEYYNLLLMQEKGPLSANELARLAELQKEWDDATSAVGKYSIETKGAADSINRVTTAQKRFKNEAQNSSVSGVLKNLQSSYDNIQNMIGSGKYTSSFVIDLAKVQDQIREIMSTPLDLDDEILRSKLVRLQGTIDETIGKKAFSDVKKAASSSLSKLELQINQFTNQNTGMGLRFKQQFENIRIRLADAKSVADVEKLASSIVKLKAEVESAGRATRSFFDILRERIVGINAQAIAQYFSWQDWIRYIRQMATTVTQLDTALTEMRKVSDESLSSLQAYQRETFETANVVGTTALALQQSTADWMRLGEAQDEAAKSAKAATVLMNVSEFQSIDEATQSLVAVSQAYKDIDKMDIIDVINNIGNNYSVATNELAEGLQNAAAVLKTQGNDLNEAVALLTAGNAITQDISKTSAGIRTISLRIAGTQEAKDQLAELGEEVDDFIVQTESKTQKLIKDYTAVASNAYKGIDVLDANGNLRNTYDILLDIAKIYKEIQDEDKKAGTNRAQALVEYIAGENLPGNTETYFVEHI